MNNNSFAIKSQEIVNDYIQSIVFLDDRAYKGAVDAAKPNNSFDALKITQSFAKSKKVCAVYQPQSTQDIEDFKIISNKADVIVLDWEINFPKTVQPGNEEDDDDHEAGLYTKAIIRHSLFDNDALKESTKIIVVYTGDYALLKSIVNDIYKEVFNKDPNFVLDEDNLCVYYSSFKVIVRAKKTEINNQTNKHYELFMVSYEDMPNFILNQFAELTTGLLPNFALLSLTTLRNNSSKILRLFSKEMDSAYLGHKSIIPKQEDSEDLLIELFGDSVKDLLSYTNLNRRIAADIEDWIDSNVLAEEFEHNNKKYNKNLDVIKALLSSKEEDARKRFTLVLTGAHGEVKNHFLDNPTKIFTNNLDLINVEKQNKNFAKLTHHKSLFIPKEIEPKLTLGSLIKSTKEDKYYICIQQKCDSVRINKNTERKFLFLPLSVVSKENKGKFDLITNSDIELKKDRSSFSIRTIKFCSNNDLGIIKAVKNEAGKYIFNQKYTEATDEQFEWILDLKDLHAQRIVMDYTNSLSRVGLDESEWLRIAGTKK